MNPYRVIIAGGRDFNDYDRLKRKADSLLTVKARTSDIVIVSGHAKGADTLGERYAKEKGFGLELYPADWEAHGKAAGVMRNKRMAEVADALIAFWDGQSRGTWNMIEEAEARKLPIRVIRYGDL